MTQANLRTWIARSLIGFILLVNVQCAVAFLVSPDIFAPGFEVGGVVGSGIVRGMGILFLMWNVPYAMAVLDPIRWRISLYEAVTMQAIGFVGESLLLVTFPPGHLLIQATLRRFILFDGFGLLALLLAAWLTRNTQQP